MYPNGIFFRAISARLLPASCFSLHSVHPCILYWFE